ncbi:MAG: trypsin-like peptidase domain-containing protein [Planctomycetes bacterium]|nr:trypsin-like peptidase domain-containing protein [Planctomycetota bacterium]
MTDNSLMEGFRSHVRPFTVRITGEWTQTEQPMKSTASGIVIGDAKDPEGNRWLAVATARHVVEDLPTTEVRWRLTRHAEDGEQPRVAELKTHGLAELSDEWPLVRPMRPGYDAAAFCVPNLCADGRPFVEDDESLPRVLAPEIILNPGNNVAWAGYPLFVERDLGAPQLCFYRGSIAATITSAEVPIYLVDGHVAQGVSGGPVWYSNENGHRVVGVVSGYRPHGEPQAMAGLCHFVPLNLLLDRLVNFPVRIR